MLDTNHGDCGAVLYAACGKPDVVYVRYTSSYQLNLTAALSKFHETLKITHFGVFLRRQTRKHVRAADRDQSTWFYRSARSINSQFVTCHELQAMQYSTSGILYALQVIWGQKGSR